MQAARCDHAIHFHGDKIYALGGMSGLANGELTSLNTCEVYSVSDDKWAEMPSFTHARQQHSICHFNEKFLFVFGGKKVKSGAKVLSKDLKASLSQSFFEPFEFVKEVEVFEFQKATWKTINYISEPEKLAIISPGSMQISGSQILIFGGVIPRDQSSNTDKSYDIYGEQ